LKGNPRRARHPKQNNITLQRTNISIEIGTTFTRHGLEYQVAGFRPHVTRSGREIELVKLASECSVCGGGFTTTATRSAVRGSARHNGITRTCPEHRGLGPPLA
jgi:hypothetical protein